MAVTPLHLESSHLDISDKFTSIMHSSCGSDIYSKECIKTPSETVMERIYLTNHVLREEDNATSSKGDQKKSIVQTIINILANISGNLSKLQTVLLPRINNSLSVTVVDEKGIIIPELFGNSLGKTEPLINDNKSYTYNIMRKQSPSITREEQNIVNVEKKKTHINQFSISNHIDSSHYNWDANDIQIHQNNRDIIVENFTQDNMHSNLMYKNNAMEFLSLPYTCETEMLNITTDYFHTIDNIHDIKRVNPQEYVDSDNDTLENEENSISNINNKNASINGESFLVYDSDLLPKPIDSIQEISISTRLSNISRKVQHDVSNRFYHRSKISVCNSEISVKRPYLLKQRRKANIVAMGRGRGRARSQLRCSGVSQTRHRKERIKHHTAIDIQNDYEIWQDIEVYHTVKNDKLDSSSSLDDADKYDVIDTTDFSKQIREREMNPLIFEFFDRMFRNDRKEKSKAHDNIIMQKSMKYSTRVRYVPEPEPEPKLSIDIDNYYEDFDTKRLEKSNPFRRRLMSESSTDSEDSYCIVFETESDTNSMSNVTDDNETSCEGENSEDDEKLMQKVKFNLVPTIHTMIQWDYAYRAARKGPWEEMARDRERFRGRISRVSAILDPILTSQHREHVWQERFALQK